VGVQRDPGFLRRLAQRLITPTRLHVLIVDPDVASARQLVSTVSRTHSVTIVGTAAAAYAAIGEHMPTLVVTELDLPDASGLDLLTMLHAHPASRDVLLMVFSLRGAVRDKIAAFQAGADDFLVKPVHPEDFATHIRRLSHFRAILPPSAS